MSSFRARVAAVATALSLTLVASVTRAQEPGSAPRTALDWKTVETRYYVFHYPEELREWSLSTASRMDAIHDAVRGVVGFVPAAKTHVVVDDPGSVSNGSAWPLVKQPVIYLWPTAPEPTSAIGANRSWGEILGVHEFAHIAHMTRPARGHTTLARRPLAWVGLGPITMKAPRWVFEGYATFVEGRLTGSGRPHGVLRPAILRQWARAGRLPTYASLNSLDGFYQGSLAYLVGSAYLEWLAEQRGDSSLVHLWRRMTARTDRSFDAAFTGVYGAPPAVLYGRFVAEVTERAMRAEDVIAGGRDTSRAGVTVQRYSWFVGSPAISPDGRMVALRIASRDMPSRVIILKTTADTVTDKERKARERLVARDPQDVPSIEIGPRPRKPVATLRARGLGGFDSPRWMPDGERLLVSHMEALPDGSRRPDLWMWNHKTKALRRITRGAGLRYGDPSPDGRMAAGVRCLHGRCDLVTVDLVTGRVQTVAAGTPTESWYRPRWSPDGRTLVASLQRGGVWRLMLVDVAGGRPARELLPPDASSRYDATYTRRGDAIVTVSEASGVPNLERIALGSGGESVREVTRLTSVFGAATGPEPDPDGRGVWFLSLHPYGMNLNRIVADSAGPLPRARLSDSLAPAASVGIARADTFATGPLSPERGYGLGPRRHLLLPWLATAVEGRAYGLTLAGTDPVGRFAYTLTAGGAPTGSSDDRVASALSAEGMWRGGSLRAEWRGMRPRVEGDLFLVEQRPGAQVVQGFATVRSFDVRYPGARLGLTLDRDFGWRTHEYRVGVVAGRLNPIDGSFAGPVNRRLAYGEYSGTYRKLGATGGVLAATVALRGSMGTTAADDWRRGTFTAGLTAASAKGGLTASATLARTDRDAAPFERFLVGGVEPPFFDRAVLSQRIAMPALPVGALGGGSVNVYRVATVGSGFQPYYWHARAVGAPGARMRAVGIETGLRMNAITFVRVPGVRMLAGAAYLLDEPFRKRVRGYGTLQWVP